MSEDLELQSAITQAIVNVCEKYGVVPQHVIFAVYGQRLELLDQDIGTFVHGHLPMRRFQAIGMVEQLRELIDEGFETLGGD